MSKKNDLERLAEEKARARWGYYFWGVLITLLLLTIALMVFWILVRLS